MWEKQYPKMSELMSWGSVYPCSMNNAAVSVFFTGLSAEKARQVLQPLCRVRSILLGVCQLIHEDPSDQLSPAQVLSSSRKQCKLADLGAVT